MDPHSLTWREGFPAPPASEGDGDEDDSRHPRGSDNAQRRRSKGEASCLDSQEARTLSYITIQIINLYDAWATLWLVQVSGVGGWAEERNPLMRLLGESLGMGWWLGIKISLVAILGGALLERGRWIHWVTLPFIAVLLLHLLAS